MTDKLIEKMQEAISEAVSEKQEGLFTVIIDWNAQAKAALSVIRENASEMVKPLVWEEPSELNNQCHMARVDGGAYYVHCDGGKRHAFYLPDCGMEELIGEASDSLFSEQSKCQNHRNSYVLSLLNMEGE